jgi:ABC-type transport system involved in multi-copper enzyme maturation permease subunit
MALVRISLLKLARRPATWVVFAILAGLIVLVFLALGASAGSLESAGDELQVRLLLTFPTAYTMVVGVILGFGGLLAVAYGASIIGADWSSGTIRAVIARGESRVRYPLVTFGAIALVLAVGVVATFALGSVSAVAASEMAGIGSAGATEAETLRTLPELLARTWLGVTQAAAIGFAIAMLFKSQLAGIGAGLALYFAELFLALVPALRDALVYFPFSVAGAVVATSDELGSGGFGSMPTLDPNEAVLWSIGYLALALAIAVASAWRAQITQ